MKAQPWPRKGGFCTFLSVLYLPTGIFSSTIELNMSFEEGGRGEKGVNQLEEMMTPVGYSAV